MNNFEMINHETPDLDTLTDDQFFNLDTLTDDDMQVIFDVPDFDFNMN